MKQYQLIDIILYFARTILDQFSHEKGCSCDPKRCTKTSQENIKILDLQLKFMTKSSKPGNTQRISTLVELSDILTLQLVPVPFQVEFCLYMSASRHMLHEYAYKDAPNTDAVFRTIHEGCLYRNPQMMEQLICLADCANALLIISLHQLLNVNSNLLPLECLFIPP